MRMNSLPGRWMLCAFTLASISSLTQSTPEAFAQKEAGAQEEGSTRKEEGPKKKKKARKKSIRQCMSFSQKMGTDDESVELSLKSRCQVSVVCSLEWEVTCVDDGTRATTPGKRSSSLEYSDSLFATASAAQCAESWELDAVKWNCVPAES